MNKAHLKILGKMSYSNSNVSIKIKDPKNFVANSVISTIAFIELHQKNHQINDIF